MGSPVAEITMIASVILLVAVVVSRRVPLAAALAAPLPVIGVALGMAFPRTWPLELLEAVAGFALAVGAGGSLVSWVLLRFGWWLPGRLSPSGGSDGIRRLKDFAEMRRLGFRRAGSLSVSDGPERQICEYFIDSTGTIAACVSRSWTGLRGIGFITEQDGARVKTSDWPFLPVLPLPPGWTLFLHHACRTPAELLRMHRIHLAELAMDAPDSCSDLPAREQRRYEEVLAEAVRGGKLTPKGPDRLRLTFAATMGLIWRSLFLDYRRKAARFDG